MLFNGSDYRYSYACPDATHYSKRVSLSFKRHWSCGVVVRCYGCYSNGFMFNSHLLFLSTLLFSGLRVTFTGQCSQVSLTFNLRIRLALVGQLLVRITRARLGLQLRLRLRLGFIFYVYFLSTKPAALSSCTTLRHRWRQNNFSNFKIHRHIYSHCLF